MFSNAYLSIFLHVKEIPPAAPCRRENESPSAISASGTNNHQQSPTASPLLHQRPYLSQLCMISCICSATIYHECIEVAQLLYLGWWMPGADHHPYTGFNKSTLALAIEIDICNNCSNKTFIALNTSLHCMQASKWMIERWVRGRTALSSS